MAYFAEVLAYLREGGILVVVKHERRGRSVRNLQQIVDVLQERNTGLEPVSQGTDTTIHRRRLLLHMIAAIAELEPELILERTSYGFAAARDCGRKRARKVKMTPARSKQTRAKYGAGEYAVQEIVGTFGVPRPSKYRHLAYPGWVRRRKSFIEELWPVETLALWR